MSNIIPETTMKVLPATVKNQLLKMPEQQQHEFLEEFNRKFKIKSAIAGRVFCWFGIHYIYLEKWMLFVLFCMTLGGFFLWWLIDFFRMTSMVRQYNQDKAKDIALDVLKEIKLLNR
jgi:TM2 domain-containing membrane protein YozV